MFDKFRAFYILEFLSYFVYVSLSLFLNAKRLKFLKCFKGAFG